MKMKTIDFRANYYALEFISSTFVFPFPNACIRIGCIIRRFVFYEFCSIDPFKNRPMFSVQRSTHFRLLIK